MKEKTSLFDRRKQVWASNHSSNGVVPTAAAAGARLYVVTRAFVVLLVVLLAAFSSRDGSLSSFHDALRSSFRDKKNDNQNPSAAKQASSSRRLRSRSDATTQALPSHIRQNNVQDPPWSLYDHAGDGGGSASLKFVTSRAAPRDVSVEQEDEQSLSSVIAKFDPSSSTSVRLLQAGEQQQCSETCCAEQYPAKCPPEKEDEPEGEANPLQGIPFWLQIILIIILILLSGMFSGLTLGLMGLDKTGLEIVMEGGDEREARYARRIYPVRKNGNLLLCTLLLGNVAVNSLLSILMADMTSGMVGFLSSTFLIVIFGEIVPQAACSRYALAVGSFCVPLVRVIIVLCWPIAAPLAWLLDIVLGAELATTYSSAEMLKMLQIHVEEKVIDKDTAVAMTGALRYRDTLVKNVMSPIEKTFMLSDDERLGFETIAKIFKTGYSRIPVYKISKNNVIGLLFVKDLIFIDPADETRLSDFVEIFGRGVHVVWPDDRLGDVLRELKQGRSHMALVRDVNNESESADPYYEIKGIITLEDIVEEILGEEIVDETDAFVDSTHQVKVDRSQTLQWARLRLLDSKIVDETLSHDEARAVAALLSKNYPALASKLTDNQLHRLISGTPVSLLSTANQHVGQDVPDELLYQKDVPADAMTLILAGKVTVLVGLEQFRSDVSSWCVLAANALLDAHFKPDFSAFVSSGPCRCLQLTRERYLAAVDASLLEKRDCQQNSNHSARSSACPPSATTTSNNPNAATTAPLDASVTDSVASETTLTFDNSIQDKLQSSAEIDASDLPQQSPRKRRSSKLVAALNNIVRDKNARRFSTGNFPELAQQQRKKEEDEKVEKQKESRVGFAVGATVDGTNPENYLGTVLSGGGLYQPKSNQTIDDEGDEKRAVVVEAFHDSSIEFITSSATPPTRDDDDDKSRGDGNTGPSE